MAINDKLEKMLVPIREDLEASPGDQVLETTLETALHHIPIAGAGIHALLAGRAQRVVRRRFLEVLEEMKIRMDEIQASIPDADYYVSEEFQTLLTLVIEQLQTAHEREKLRALAHVLANSGTQAFDGMQKELSLRILRDLSAWDLYIMSHPQLWSTLAEKETDFDYKQYAAMTASLTRLASYGLILRSERDNKSTVRYGKAHGVAFSNIYSLFGYQFLDLLSLKTKSPESE